MTIHRKDDGLERDDAENAICKGRVQTKLSKDVRGALYRIEDPAAEVCTGCGERYFHATTLDEIDRYLLADHKVKEWIHVEVISL